MLWTPVNEFNSRVDNFAGVYSDASLGTAVTANASANVKGTAVQLLAALADSCYFLEVLFARTNTIAEARGFLVDILYDPAGGTNWQVLIPNLLVHQPSLITGGYSYAFPIYIPAGSTVGAQCQSSTGSSALRVGVCVFGKPSRPDLIYVGSKVQALGVNTGTSRGTSITPGNAAHGSYTATLGTLNFDAWWWQAGITTTDTTTSGIGYQMEVAANASNKVICARDIGVRSNSSEQFGKSALGPQVPIRRISSGQDVYIRAACSAAPDATMSCAAYALGG